MGSDNLILAGDIGGTKTNLAVFSRELGLGKPLASDTYASAAYAGLEEMIGEFLGSAGLAVSQAAFGVAGPVLDGQARITKLPWTVDSLRLKESFSLSQVVIANDLVATASALPVLGDDDLVSLNPGRRQQHAPQAVIAPGTGLGETFMLWDGSRYQPYPSEGGHALFAPANELQDKLLSYLHRGHASISYDFICSGRGIPLVYEFLRGIDYAEEFEEVSARLGAAADASPVITEAAMAEQPSPLCAAAIELFAAILAAESANLALKVLARGGIFLGGGMPARILPVLRKNFMADFIGHRVLSEMLADIPVQVIINPKAALLGAARLICPDLGKAGG